MMRRALPALFLAVMALAIGTAHAVLPDEMLADPAQEARAREISKDLRCLVCQNQSIDDSNADLARDMRILVRERIKAGDSDQEIRDFLVARYGDFVLLKPPVEPETYALWLTPPLALLIGAGILIVWYRGRQAGSAATTEQAALSPDDEARIRALMGNDDNKGGKA